MKRLLISFLILFIAMPQIGFAKDGRTCALVAGGSKGIGFSIAEALAKRNWDLVLVARHLTGLEDAKTKLEKAYGIEVHLLQQDLSQTEAPDVLWAYCEQQGLQIQMLCNVAGFGGEKDYLELPPDSIRYMMRLNFESAVMLTHKFLPMLEQNGPSYILNVASMAGFAPMPIKNIYAATKAAVVFFSYSLRQQLKGKKVSVSCLAPGPVYTKPAIVETTHKSLGKTFGDWMEVPPEKVGEIAIRRTLKGRPMIVPGNLANFSSGIIRFLPLRWMAAIYGR